MEGTVVLIESPRKGAQMRPDYRIANRCHRASCGHEAVAFRCPLARGALPESGLAALPPEENAELVKRLAEEIREAADEYQRKMRVVH
jgi:hypothetical protein